MSSRNLDIFNQSEIKPRDGSSLPLHKRLIRGMHKLIENRRKNKKLVEVYFPKPKAKENETLQETMRRKRRYHYLSELFEDDEYKNSVNARFKSSQRSRKRLMEEKKQKIKTNFKIETSVSLKEKKKVRNDSFEQKKRMSLKERGQQIIEFLYGVEELRRATAQYNEKSLT